MRFIFVGIIIIINSFVGLTEIIETIGEDYVVADTLQLVADTVVNQKNNNLYHKFISYFNDANKEKDHKKFDFNFIGGPHYASDTPFGLGLVGAG